MRRSRHRIFFYLRSPNGTPTLFVVVYFHFQSVRVFIVLVLFAGREGKDGQCEQKREEENCDSLFKAHFYVLRICLHLFYQFFRCLSSKKSILTNYMGYDII